jgi:hypothetical protein
VAKRSKEDRITIRDLMATGMVTAIIEALLG